MTEHITLAGGCFWCTEAVFSRLRGVASVSSGYANGHTSEPSYDQVCSGATGHAEAVRIGFDPSQISVQDVLAVFLSSHDPTTLNRQGNDVGSQYRSGIYWETPEQGQAAHAAVRELRERGVAVVTEVEPLTAFWPAEAMHERYHERHPEQRYCALVIEPKLAHLREQWQRLLRPGT